MRIVLPVSTRVISAAAWLVVACGGGDAPPAEPPAADTELTEVADGIYRFRFNRHNTMFVVTGTGVVAFDPISTEAAALLAEAIAEVAPGVPLRTIVYSHRDADHATGAAVLRDALGADAPIVAHANALAPLAAAADPDLPPPDSTFADRLTLGEGDDRIELSYLGRSHSDDMLVAYVPRGRLAFAVDFVAHDRLGYRDLGSFYFPDMFDAMAGLQAIPYEAIVFGHGPVGDRASVERQIRYYRDLEQAVGDAVASGLSEDEAAAQVRLEAYETWDGYGDWRELNVRGMYRALTRG